MRVKDEVVAVKLEEVTSRVPQLAYEYRLYKIFEGNVDGMPRV